MSPSHRAPAHIHKRRKLDAPSLSKTIFQDGVPCGELPVRVLDPACGWQESAPLGAATAVIDMTKLQCTGGLNSPARAACKSCGRRALATRGVAPMLVCPRCKSTTCAICSRTCEGGSLPSSTRLHSASPGRPPLNACNSGTLVAHPPVHAQAPSPRYHKRRLSSASVEDTPPPKARQDVDDPMNAHQGLSNIAGCEEVFCKSCVVEDPLSHSTACLDCIDRQATC
ncbi:hypothetical protein PsYK624_102590 [Phanerochaete sordida]|uniref:Uncharacterized protein n=1 Tax=Phanerochaete sordida TaxID=48140 RepID=A0A9P3LG12_9APHY|nr:hypothetical protein PsYK624_102590 [Phanerochaete sordida]